MKILSKLIMSVESALISSAVWLWNLIVKSTSTTIKARTSDNLLDPPIEVIESTSTFYPYQTLAVALLVIAGILGAGYFIHYWKNKPIPQNYLQGWIKNE